MAAVEAQIAPSGEPWQSTSASSLGATDQIANIPTGESLVNGALKERPQQAHTTGLVASYPVSKLKLENRLIDDVRKLRVAVIGAGLSGVLAGVLFPAKVPNIELTIFEKNADVVSLHLH